MGTRHVNFLGRTLIRPGARAAFQTTPGQGGASPDLNTLVLIGPADNGWYANDTSLDDSLRVMEFGSPEESKAVLTSGDLADAIKNSFSPSKDNRFSSGPVLVRAINVNPNVSANASAASTALGVTHTISANIPGPKGNQIRFRVTSSGTVVQIGDSVGIQTSSPFVSGDIQIQYTGNATKTLLTFDGIKLNVTLTGQTDSSKDLNALVKDYTTISNLVAFINSQVGYTASVVSKPDLLTASLDYVLPTDSMDIRNSYYLTSLFFQQRAYFKSQGLSSIIPANVNKPIADMANFTYLSGGLTGIAKPSDWISAIDLVFNTEAAKGFYVNICSHDDAVRAHFTDKVSSYNSPDNADKRFGGVGIDVSKTVDERVSDIKSLDLEYITAGNSPVTLYAADDTTLKTYNGWMVAVLHNACKAAANVRESITNKALNIVNVPETYGKVEIDKYLDAGSLIVTRKANKGPFKIEFALTAYQKDDPIRNQTSTICTALALTKDIVEWANSIFIGEVITDPDTFDGTLNDADIRTAVTTRFKNVYVEQYGWLTKNIFTGDPAIDPNFLIQRDGNVVSFVMKNGKIVTPLDYMLFLIGLDVVRGSSNQ
ncbi:hypothetical protein LEP1GSC050_0102 [Leptospira phage vB_LbrZ_5399-LE1]|uniref:Tail sheath protein n=1 Tax=Leptospira inadai serovar Lyme TaxID=293084 RepID=A0ABX4YGI3_9LEPT|nr:hypothetical protein [Leptospira inadai]AGS80730.1 hypothetical protein LEP1GSC050_0102 [Leptospira phage vB_LbrZ_5399-LE1]AGS80869.1 hypothetical protein LEP1GSC047_0870 [Leptospira phage vB_LinZ_10-LE1]PNV74360.1 hypothetical protein BES34_014345 [Leptospira inadai serovar Lyme]